MTGKQRILMLVTIRPGLSAFQIAGILHLDPASTASMLKRMLDAGQVTRRPDSGPRQGYTYDPAK